MNIYIAGCARSGTDLTRNLFRCFRNTYVISGENSPQIFIKNTSNAAIFVAKRTHNGYLSLPQLSDDVLLVYCVRHPLDCLTSSHTKTRHLRRFHVTQERWLSEYQAYLALKERQPNRRSLIVRYEDLVFRPNDIQQNIAKCFNLVAECLFTDNPDKRSIFTNSVGKWRRDSSLIQCIDQFDSKTMLKIYDFCREFGYEWPKFEIKDAG